MASGPVISKNNVKGNFELSNAVGSQVPPPACQLWGGHLNESFSLIFLAREDLIIIVAPTLIFIGSM